MDVSDLSLLAGNYRDTLGKYYEEDSMMMASEAVPEPVSAFFLGVGGILCLVRRKLRGIAGLVSILALLAGPGVSLGDQSVMIDDAVDLGSGLYSYTIRLVADTAAEASGAWDGSFEGTMNQVWAFSGYVPTPSMTYASYLSSEDLARDSHFLFYNDYLTQVEAPSETSDGSYLGMACAFDPSIRSQNFQLAQIVVATDESVTLSGVSADTTGAQWATEAMITGGQDALRASWKLETEDRSVKTGQVVTISGTPTQDAGGDQEWWVFHQFSMGDGRISMVGPVAQITDSDFEFVPTEPGKYWIARTVDPDAPIIVGGDIHPSQGQRLLEFTVTPEPASLGLFAAGGLALLRRRSARRACK